jgi:hypothetical protein
MKIIDYLVVLENDGAVLVREVKRLVGEGWQPHGGVSFTMMGGVPAYVQALVKYEEN